MPHSKVSITSYSWRALRFCEISRSLSCSRSGAAFFLLDFAVRRSLFVWPQGLFGHGELPAFRLALLRAIVRVALLAGCPRQPLAHLSFYLLRGPYSSHTSRLNKAFNVAIRITVRLYYATPIADCPRSTLRVGDRSRLLHVTFASLANRLEPRGQALMSVANQPSSTAGRALEAHLLGQIDFDGALALQQRLVYEDIRAAR